MSATGGNFAAPANEAAVIAHSDTVNLATKTRGLYVGGAGHITAVMSGGDGTQVCLFSAVPAGTILPISVKRINATGTTATLIVGLY